MKSIAESIIGRKGSRKERLYIVIPFEEDYKIYKKLESENKLRYPHFITWSGQIGFVLTHSELKRFRIRTEYTSTYKVEDLSIDYKKLVEDASDGFPIYLTEINGRWV